MAKPASGEFCYLSDLLFSLHCKSPRRFRRLVEIAETMLAAACLEETAASGLKEDLALLTEVLRKLA